MKSGFPPTASTASPARRRSPCECSRSPLATGSRPTSRGTRTTMHGPLEESNRLMISKYRSEYLEQPSRLRALLQAYAQDEAIRTETRALREAMDPGLPVLWLGMGASYCSGIAGSVTLAGYG